MTAIPVQFSILRVRAATGIQQEDEIFMERYLNFSAYPKCVGLSEDLAGATMFHLVSETRHQGEKFMENLRKDPELNRVFTQEHPEVHIIVDYIHYQGSDALSITGRSSVVDTTILRRQEESHG